MTSMMLKRAGLKAFSGPFDWIFSSFDMVRDCIESDFADFLNIDYLKPVPAERRQAPTLNFCDHILYKQRYGLDSIFNHYDPRDPERYNYLRRCVRRFRALLASGDPHLLLAIGRFGSAEDLAFDRLRTSLAAQHPNIEARLIRLGQPGGGAAAHVEFAPLSADDGVQFSDERDNDRLADLLRQTIDLI